MRLYAFEELDDRLELMPLAARRAADAAGLKPSLAAWRSLSVEDRAAVARAGSALAVDVAAVDAVLSRARPEPGRMAPVADPPASEPPPAVRAAFEPERPLANAVWSALSPLDRYALAKVAAKGDPARLAAAYAEIVGRSAEVTHVDATGQARMVGISEKPVTARRAVAESRVLMSPEAFARLERADTPKGDVLGTARLAGIMGAKRTSDLIPLCHPIALTRVDVRLELVHAEHAVAITAAVEAFDRTGVEMEALTAASTAALTVYDMLKAFDRGMSIGPTRLREKSGGRSGDFVAPRPAEASRERFALSETPIAVERAAALVARRDAGGTVLFVGTVRDHNAEGPVTQLEYQAYATMAVKEMARIAEQIEAEIPGTRLAALHRTGSLRVGDVAVVCAASAPHRDEAFRAARLLIDRIKERVPIWKREHGQAGPYWVNWQDARTTPKEPAP